MLRTQVSRKLLGTKSSQSFRLIVFTSASLGTLVAASFWRRLLPPLLGTWKKGVTSTGLGLIGFSVLGNSVDTLCLTVSFKSKRLFGREDLTSFDVGVYTRASSSSGPTSGVKGLLAEKGGCCDLSPPSKFSISRKITYKSFL